jgi:DNA-binding response OmpR family regulator
MSLRILIIDDEEHIRNVFSLALEKEGYKVFPTATGEEALSIFSKEKIDLIFLDLHMPGIDGIEVLKKIREKDKKVPIFIVTGFYMGYKDELKALEAFGLDFELLIKPVDAEQIKAAAYGVLVGPYAVKGE